VRPDQVGGEEAQQRQRDHGDDQPGAGQPERQIGFRPVGDGHERPDQAVDPVHEPPGQIKGDGDRAGDDQTGQKIVPESGHEAPRGVRRISRGLGRRQVVAVHWGFQVVEAAVVQCQLSNPSRFLKTPTTVGSVTLIPPVTDFARFRGWSTSVPMTTAV